MELAGRFGLPVLSFVDTAGAYPGRGAEERGRPRRSPRPFGPACGCRHRWWRASSVRADRAAPCACRRQQGGDVRARHIFGDLAGRLRLDPVAQQRSCQGSRRGASHHSSHMKDLGVIDAIVTEPLGGAHRDQTAAIASLGDTCYASFRSCRRWAARRCRRPGAEISGHG